MIPLTMSPKEKSNKSWCVSLQTANEKISPPFLGETTTMQGLCNAKCDQLDAVNA